MRYEPEHQSPERKPISNETIAAGLRGFFRICELWGLNNEQARTLLGGPARATFHKWKKGEFKRTTQPIDLASRVGHVLGIFKSLEILYSRPEIADSWVKRPNKAFGGQSALDRMLAGQITDLASVRNYLDSVRSGW